MSRLTQLAAMTGAALLFGAAGYMGAYWAYRAAKLRLIEPKPLQRPIEWAGPSDARCALLLVGDSRVARWPLEAPPGWRVGRLGFAGEAAVNIEPAVRDQIATARADVVAIQAGGNDVTAAVFQREPAREETIVRAADAVIAIGENARRAGAGQVIVLTLVPPIEIELWKRALMGSAQAELMTRLGNAILRKARAQGMTGLDADHLFRDAEGRLRRDYRSDSIHWSAAGYRALNAALWTEAKNCAG